MASPESPVSACELLQPRTATSVTRHDSARLAAPLQTICVSCGTSWELSSLGLLRFGIIALEQKKAFERVDHVDIF